MSNLTGETILNEEGASAILFKKWSAEDLFHQLALVTPWQQNRIRVFGNWHDEPRLTCWYGPRYTYSNIAWPAAEMTPMLQKIAEQITAVSKSPYNSVLLNYYRSGNDSMGWHRDNEPEIDPASIASLSFGGVRIFKIRKRKTKDVRTIELSGRDLLLMNNMQDNWEHCIPKSLRFCEPRINLTFRQIIP
jgi:alkylated DNA repair dioxygenase AlkB